VGSRRRAGAEPEPGLHAPEGLLAFTAGALLAAAMFWPLPLHIGGTIPKDLGDPLLQAWQVAWDGHALLHQPLHFFQSNTFWPLKDSLAFSDALIGYTPAGLLGHGWKAAVARYDGLFLFAYALAFAGAYLLACEAGLRRPAAVIAGVAFAFAPWKLEQNGHLHVISSGGIPLSLFLLLRGFRRRVPWLVVAGFAVAAWQVSLGFTLGLQLLYLLAVGAAVGAVWLWRRRPALDRRLLRATLAGVALLVAVTVVLVRPYLRVLHEYPESKRTVTQVAAYSPPVRSYLAASPQDLVWGKATAGMRRSLSSVPEQTLFPGVTIALLALLGSLAGPWRPRTRIALVVATLLAAVCAMGLRFLDGRLTYRLLYDYAPGWQGIRTPGRITVVTSLLLALLAGGGAQWLLLRPRGRAAAALIAAILFIAILAEGSALGLGERGKAPVSGPAEPRVPGPPPGQLGQPSPQLHLPIRARREYDYMLWSTEGFPRIVNGTSGFPPRFLRRLALQVRGFPSRASVARLRSLGVRTVILHPDYAAGTPWSTWSRRSVKGLGVTRHRRGGVVVYSLTGG
jgi:hypothetical protein